MFLFLMFFGDGTMLAPDLENAVILAATEANPSWVLPVFIVFIAAIVLYFAATTKRL